MRQSGGEHEAHAERRGASRPSEASAARTASLTEPALARLQRAAGNRAVAGLVQRSLGTTPKDADAVRHEPNGDEEGWKVFNRSSKALYTLKHVAGNIIGGVKPDDKAWGPATPDAARKDSRKAYDDSLGAPAAAGGAFDYNRLLVSPGYPKDDFRYWVYYMLEQVTDVARKRAFLQQAFEPNEGRTLKPELAKDDAKKRLLQDIFAVGFVSYEKLAEEQKKTLVRPGAELANQIPGENRFGYGFRGDNRTPDKLVGAGGFTTKAESKDTSYRTSMGLDKPWNPFGDQATLPGQNATKNAGYFRRGDTDNDLTTIISVTPNFVDATKFPFIQEYMEGTSVVEHDGQQRRRSVTHVYLVLVEQGFDTKAAQGSNAFPEIATRTVPMENVAAVYDIERIHFGSTKPNANDGHIARLLSYRILDGARARYEGTPSWATVLRAIETYATLGQLEYKPQETAPAPKEIRLSVSYKSRPGEDLFVAGSIPELGNWDPARAVPMTYTDENTWSLVHQLPPGNSISKGRRFEYKFLVKEKGAVRWEGDPNHDYDPAVRVGTSKPERWHR